jgi:hypothetical protein
MGFLQNDTTNIINDAVLTTKGRELLAKQAFRITKYAFFDDEVDYTNIKKYGRTIGKEKIEKTTPVFEGITNEGLAVQSRLVSLSNPNVVRMPLLALAATGGTQSGNTVSITKAGSTQLTVSQTVETGAQIDEELKDSLFVVEVDNKFLRVDGQTPRSISPFGRAIYHLVKDPGTVPSGGTKVTFTIRPKPLSQTEFDTYGLIYEPNTIESFITIYGLNSGTNLSFGIKILNQ